MKIRYLALTICITGLFISNTPGQNQERNKADNREGLKCEDKGSLAQHEGRDRRLMNREGSGMLGGENGIQEIMLGRIVNNPRLASEIGLSEDQIRALKSSVEEMKKQHEDFNKRLKESALEQAKIMTGDSADENAIMAAVEKTGGIRTEMAKSRIRQMLMMRKMLKPEQIARIREMAKNRMKQISGEKEKQDLRGKGGNESLMKSRIHERRKKLQQEENKDGKKSEP